MTRHVFLCADADYVVPLAVTLRSLAVTQSRQEVTQVTVLSIGISPSDKDRLQGSAHPLAVKFIEIEDRIPADMKSVKHLSRAAYGRLVGVGSLPSEVDRAIYLDADLIVREDLEFLFSFDLGGSPIAATQSVGIPHIANPLGLSQWRDLGLDPTTRYMNSGVIVIDTEAWRSEDLGNAIVEFIRENQAHLSLADQDGFNGVLAGDFARLPLRWNQEHFLRRPTHFGYSLFPHEEVDEAIRNAAIVHFTGPWKPWKRNCGDPATSEWRELLRSTEFRDFTPQRASYRRRALNALHKVLRV